MSVLRLVAFAIMVWFAIMMGLDLGRSAYGWATFDALIIWVWYTLYKTVKVRDESR